MVPFGAVAGDLFSQTSSSAMTTLPAWGLKAADMLDLSFLQKLAEERKAKGKDS